MARYGVQVIGDGDECFVVANIPGEGGFRKGPMPEARAMAIAREMSAELFELSSSKEARWKNDKREMIAGVITVLLVVVGGLWWLVSR